MTDIELMIGQSSTEAERKRAARLENKALLPSRTKGGHLSDIRPPEIEIELEKEIEIEKEREGETGHPAPAAYGRYNNVILTDTELSGLKTELPDKWEYYIDRLSCHIASTGKQYHSHAATIYKWAQEDAAKGKAAPKQGIPDYSCKEGESLCGSGHDAGIVGYHLCYRVWPNGGNISRVQKRRFSSKGGVRAVWEPGFSKPVKKSIKDVKSVTLASSDLPRRETTRGTIAYRKNRKLGKPSTHD